MKRAASRRQRAGQLIRVISVGLAAVGLAGSPLTCSLKNQEGPVVTCEDLKCGQINACQDSIIAQCADGMTVRYHVCKSYESDDDDVCAEGWQTPGWYRCTVSDTDCEGCRPERNGCPWPPAEDSGEQGGGGAGGDVSSGGGAGSTT